MRNKVAVVALLLFVFGVTSVSAQEVQYSVPEMKASTPKVEKKSTTKKPAAKKKAKVKKPAAKKKKKAATKKPTTKKKAASKSKAKKEDLKDAQEGLKEMKSALKESKKDLDEGLKDIEAGLKDGNVKVQHIVPRKPVKFAAPRESTVVTGLRSFGLNNILSLIGGMFMP